jgi:hypothetical protein
LESLGVGELGGEGRVSPSSKPPESVPVPIALIRQMDELVKEHQEGRERRAEGAYRLFEELIPENRGRREILEPHVNQWLDTTEWFMQRTHDGGLDDGQFKIEEFCAKFELVEATLLAVIEDFFKTTDELDAILDRTNN